MATLGDIEQALHQIAPLELAQEWDNVGLLAGDRADVCRGVLLCIDLSPAVLAEAQQVGANLLVCYHPPLFKPIHRLRADQPGTESLLWRAARLGLAIYSPHTALDAAEGGTNDVIAGLCGLTDVEPLGLAEAGAGQCKVVVFVPEAQVDKVAEAMFAAGAGWIGQYHHCSFRLRGEGTFWGTQATKPVVGEAGRLERVEEIRLEAVCPRDRVPEVVNAIRGSHPYEEPAFDIYPLRTAPARTGVGRVGTSKPPMPARQLADKIARAVGSKTATLAGDAAAMVERAGVVVGSAGRWALEQHRFAQVQVLVTGELKHHDALAHVAAGKVVIALGHWASERPVLASLAGRMAAKTPGAAVRVSQADQDVWRAV
jgi:dinuclear metal center YbgI/SA1388 family protein